MVDCWVIIDFQKREERFRYTSESTNNRVFWWAVAQTSTLVVMALLQTSHLRRFFISKKLVWCDFCLNNFFIVVCVWHIRCLSLCMRVGGLLECWIFIWREYNGKLTLIEEICIYVFDIVLMYTISDIKQPKLKLTLEPDTIFYLNINKKQKLWYETDMVWHSFNKMPECLDNTLILAIHVWVFHVIWYMRYWSC